MLGVGEKLPEFKITGVKPGFNHHEEKGVSAFEPVDQKSFPGKWKVIFFYPKDFTFVCPTEITAFAVFKAYRATRGGRSSPASPAISRASIAVLACETR